MTEKMEKVDGYRKALSVHLHDQLVIITEDAYSFATDSGWTEGNGAEYKLAYNTGRSLEKLIEGLTGRVVNLEEMGFHRTYAEYPTDGLKLKRLEVCEVSERKINIRMALAVKDGDDDWVENWTYSGSYTVRWDDVEASDG